MTPTDNEGARGPEWLFAAERSTIWLAIEAGVYGHGRDKRPEAYAALERLVEALEVATDLLREEGYDTDPDYVQEWQTVTGGANV